MKKFINFFESIMKGECNSLKKAFIYNKILNSVERNRFLYGTRFGWLVFSIVSIGVFVSVIWLFAVILIDPSSLLCQDPKNEDNLCWAIISQFSDPGNLHMSADGTPAGIALISALFGVIFLSGFLVSSIINYISKRSNEWRKGLITYNKLGKLFFKDYVIVIGVNEQTATIIKTALQRPKVRYVLIQTSSDVEEVRMKLNLKLDKSEEKRIVYYHGERTSEEDIKKLRLKSAVEVFVLGEDMRNNNNEQDHDAFNMACLEHISTILKKTKTTKKDNEEKLRCHVSFEYQSTFMTFKATHIYSSLNDEKLEFLPFNVHELWAKKVLVDCHAVIPIGKHGKNKVIRYLPLDAYWVKREGTGHWDIKYINEDSDLAVHLVIVGMNQMGVALGMEAALLTHLPNFVKKKNPNLRTTITFIDDNAGKEGEYLRGRYDALFSLCRYRMLVCGKDDFTKHPITEDSSWKNSKIEEDARYAHLGNNFMDIQWEFIEGNIANPEVRKYLSFLAEDIEHRTTTVAVCLNNPQQSIATALYLPESVLKRSLQILVYQQNSYEMIDKVSTSEKEWKRYERLKPFGIIEGSYSGGVLENQLAEFTNLVYDYLGQGNKSELDRVTIDFDTKRFRANRLWHELGIVYKLANVNLADSIAMKRRSLMNDDGEISKLLPGDMRLKHLALAEHNRWLTERLTMGYRPLDKVERDNIEGQNIIYDKDYYKRKSRAHVDICSIEDVEKYDYKTFERNTDLEIVSRMEDLLLWEQMAYLRDIYCGKFHDKILVELVKGMIEVSDSLWMSKNLVTQKQWYHIMGTEGNEESLSDDPIVNVSKEEIDEFLLLLNKKTKLQFRLPTQTEWTNAKVKAEIQDMEGRVWQWTRSRDMKYESSFVFCGKSKEFMGKKWLIDQSYWLPNFKSSDLGFRLVLPYSYRISDINSDKPDYKPEDDDEHVIDELVKYMVKVEDKKHELPTFYIQQTPVTQRQWKAVMRGEAVSRGKREKTENPSANRGDYNPVENVSFWDAEDFVNALNRKKRARFSLPTYEQWRCAVKSDKADRDRILYNEITKSTRRVVWPPQQDKIYDMFGNVWEWCTNSSDGKKPLPENEPGIVRMLMGGSWRITKKECLDPDGSCWIPEYKDDDVGFRIVISEEEYLKIQ